MSRTAPILAELAGGGIQVSLGVAIILAALILVLGAFIGGAIFSRPRPGTSRSSVKPTSTELPSSGAVQDIPAPVLAVIAAAVRTALEDEHFVLRGVRAIDPRESLAWSAEGRRSIYASKNLR